jgi:hypothetical protein
MLLMTCDDPLLAYRSFIQATAPRGADTEHRRCWCNAGVMDDKLNSKTDSRRTQLRYDRRTPHFQ